MNCIIRQTAPADAGAVLALVNNNLDDYFHPDIVDFFLMQWPTGQFIATDFLNRPLGVLVGSRLSRGRASISLLAVNSGVRSMGVGTQLLAYFRRRCMMEGYSMMQLEVRTTNASAIRFYEKQGFRISETLPNFYSNGGSAYRMVCNVMEDAEHHTV